MSDTIRLPFIGEERTRILEREGYDFYKIKDSTPEEIAGVLKVSKYIAYLIVDSANRIKIDSVPEELSAHETLCPQCGNVITELEYECGVCGYEINTKLSADEYSEKVKEYVDTFVALSWEPENITLWEKLMHILEDLGNIEEALDISLKIDMLKESKVENPMPVEESEAATKVVKYKKRKFKNGIEDGFGKYHRKQKSAIMGVIIALIIVGSTLLSVMFLSSPYKVDGNFGEWSAVPTYHTFNGDISILKVGRYGNFVYMMFGKHLYTEKGVNVLIDSDGSSSTGYLYNGLGLEYRLWIIKKGNALHGTIYAYHSSSQNNWSAWKAAGGFPVAGGDGGIELRIPSKYIGEGARVIVNDYMDETEPIGIFKPLVVAKIVAASGSVSTGDKIGTLIIENTDYKAQRIRGVSVSDLSNVSANVELRYRNNTIAVGKLGEFIQFKNPISVVNSVSLDIIYKGGSQNGSAIRPTVKSVSGAFCFSYTTGDGVYVNYVPSKPKIDGIFSDWTPYRRLSSSNPIAPNEDIVSYAKYSEKNTSYFYLQTRGAIASGIIVPIYGSNDSDRDGIPDSLDPYPHDFNNDGIPDNQSYVIVNGNRLPDVDKDGIPDYPYGSDMWLNTTIPNSTAFPAKYRGKFVSVYIGPVKNEKPIYPYDYIEIYISGKNGYSIGGIEAKYLFRLYGLSGNIKGYEFKEYENGEFVSKKIDFSLEKDLAKGWARLEFKIPLSIHGREVLYRIVSYGGIYKDTAHEPFKETLGIDIPHPHSNPNDNSTSTQDHYVPIGSKDNFAGNYAKMLKAEFGDEVNTNKIDMWIREHDLSKGYEKLHIFSGKDFIDGNASHFKEEKYAALKLRELKKENPDKPVYRVELLNSTIYKEEWENLTVNTKKWVVLHYMHDLERYRLKEFGWFRPYKENWYDEKAIRTIEWIVYQLSQNLSNWRLAFMAAKGIKSLDDARLGPLYIPPENEGTRSGSDPAVTVHVVDYYSGESDCHGDNDIYYYVWIGNKEFESPERDDQDSWSGDDVYTNSSVTGNTVQIVIHVYEADSGLCGGDDDYGYVTMTYNLTTKTWSGGTASPFVETNGDDGWCDVWFHIQSDSDNNPGDLNYGTVGVGGYGYIIQSYNGKSNYNDPSDDWTFSIDSSLISSGATIYFYMAPNSGADFNIALYDPNGNLKGSSANAGKGGSEDVFYTLKSGDTAGTWKARVSINSTSDYGDYYFFLWCGYKVEFHAETDNPGAHTPMDKNNGVAVSYVILGNTHYVYPNDDYYWTVYVDRNSPYSYAAESNNSNDASGHRWISQNPPSGRINAGGSIVGHYYEQFYLTVKTPYDTGYSSGKYFGSDQSYSDPGSGWYDAGCTVTIRVDSPVSEGGYTYAFASWTGDGPGSYSGTDNPASFTLQGVTIESANWNEVPEFSPEFYILLSLSTIFILCRRRLI